MSETKLLWILERVVSKATEYLRRVQGKRGIERVYWKRGLDETRAIDWDVEELIIKELERAKLNALVVSEERDPLTIGNEDKLEYIIVVDPLDGSLNYLVGIPYSSVSIAVAKYKHNATLNDVELGVIQSVFTGDVYVGVKGKGVMVNGVKLMSERRVSQGLILGYLNDGAYNVMFEVEKVTGPFKFRSLGCASLDLMLVVKGEADLFVDLRSKLRVTDLAAAYVILKEAECIVTDGQGNPIDASISTLSHVPSVIVFRNKNVYEKYRFIFDLAKKFIFSNQPSRKESC